MTNLEEALESLKNNIIEMADLVNIQMTNSKEVIENLDSDLIDEIISMDKRVNAMELVIDRDCENILALYNPVATDLRFVIAGLKINHDLERIGDNIRGIARAAKDILTLEKKNLIKDFKVYEMIDLAVAIIDDACQSLEKDDTTLVRNIFKKDKKLDEFDEQSATTAIDWLKKNPELSRQILAVYTIVKKVERIGDLSTNLGEEIIFYLEAKVLKHKKKLKNME